MNYLKRFKVKPGSRIKLKEIDPGFTGEHESQESALNELEKCTKRLRELQHLLYAEGKRSMLICLQGLDASGKDGTIIHVLGAMNPQGTRVYSFKVPSKEETEHDFLWRIHKQTPARGEVAIFNRSHYEDVLVVRVHNLVSEDIWSKRFDAINQFEKNLADGGTHILKFFLHISPDEQLRRFEQRLEDPARLWKISESDYSERKLWDQYIKAYEAALSRTSANHAPWYIIPSNHKWFRNLAISEIVAKTMESLDMKYPEPTVDIGRIRRTYYRELKESEGGKDKKINKKK
jgi:PPK2 family polyphosphate:nucleotide phosphotransferase